MGKDRACVKTKESKILRAIFCKLFFLILPVVVWGAEEPDLLDLQSQTVKSLGAGGAYASIAEGVYAFNKNPAGISRNAEVRRLAVQNHFTGRRKDWSLGAGIIDGITEDPVHWGFYFSTAHTREVRLDRYVLAASYNYENLILVGISNRLSNFGRATTTRNLWSYGGQAGVLAFLTDTIAIGASGENLVRSESSGTLLPVMGTTGASLNLKDFRFSADFERNFSEKLNKIRGGLELKPSRYLVVRGGVFFDTRGKDAGYTSGFTVNPQESFELSLGILDQLESSFYVISMGLGFDI